jgi:3-dehydroquinate synthase
MRGMITEREAERIIALILRYGPLSRFRATAEKLVALTANDKKNRSGSLSFVLPKKIGVVEIVRDVTKDEMLKAAEWMLALMRSQGDPAKPAKKRA